MNGARIRTLIVAVGLGSSSVVLGSACLDYAGEDYGVCPPPGYIPIVVTGGSGLGSGRGTALPAPMPTSDCGAPLPGQDGGDSGARSAQP